VLHHSKDITFHYFMKIVFKWPNNMNISKFIKIKILLSISILSNLFVLMTFGIRISGAKDSAVAC
jgi:hypothetical protein